MLNFPAVDASDDDWDEFTDARSEELVSNLRDFIVERFAYKPRYVQQQVSSSFGTVSAKTKNSTSTFASSLILTIFAPATA